MDTTIEQLTIIKNRMLAAGISEEETDKLIRPVQEELTRRICGLVWEHEGATTKLVESMKDKLPVLTPVLPVKDANGRIVDGHIVHNPQGQNHILIEGENLLALMAMQYTHIDDRGNGMIDAIYIDPPYNTGNVTFDYNDRFEKSEWLSMMNVRLKLAKNLLKDDGTIFIQIDDKNVAYLRLLCDDVFGDGHLVNTIVVEMASSGGTKRSHKDQHLMKTKEYVLMYSKSGRASIDSPYDVWTVYDRHYSIFFSETTGIESVRDKICGINSKYSDLMPEQYLAFSDVKQFLLSNCASIFRSHAPSSWAKTNLTDKNKASVIWQDDTKVTRNQVVKVYNDDHSGFEYLMRIKQGNSWGYERLEPLAWNYHNNELCVLRGDLWKGFYKDMGNVTKEGGGYAFPNGKKPVRLIKELLKLVTKPDAVILDFFAGSGTTGQAVMELNQEDGGHRQCILCTNNELGKEAKQKAKRTEITPDMPEWQNYGVCRDVTYPRLNTVITGITRDGKKYSDGMPQDNLYYYRISDSLQESGVFELDRNAMAQQAVSYIALKERAYDEEVHDQYHLLHNADKTVMVVLNPYESCLEVQEKYAELIKGNIRRIYCATSSRTVQDGIEYIPYPEEVLKILKAAKKENEVNVA